MKKSWKMCKRIAVLAAVLMLGAAGISSLVPMNVYATEGGPGQVATEEQRNTVRGKLNRYYSYLKMTYDISEENLDKMDKLYNNAMTYMQRTDLAYSELVSYEATFEEQLKTIATQNIQYGKLMLSNEVPVTSANYGEDTFVVLSLINMGETDITNVVITPHVSNKRAEWPFEIDQATNAQSIPIIQAAYNTDDAYNKRMDIGWNFKVREDASTGCYPLVFDAIYYCQDGSKAETSVTTYINIKGKNPNNTLDEKIEEVENISIPRIVVTGFTTEPEEVYAGSVFQLNIKVKNTSADMAVENVLFDLTADVETGSGTNTETYAAFLPTSGSNSVYAQKIEAGADYEINIEMEAKADLSQKPYVLTVTSNYFYGDGKDATDVAKVSIPVKQEAKADTGSAEVMPESIAVGEQSNVMFSVFNTGKTTLYNVKVTFESDSVSSGITYLGNLAPGGTGNVDAMVTGVAPDDGSGIVNAVITYEDEAGNETRFEREINLSVYDAPVEEPMEYPTDDMEIEEPAGIPVGLIAGIVIAVIVVVIIIIVIIKKKKAKKLKEELEALDDEV